MVFLGMVLEYIFSSLALCSVLSIFDRRCMKLLRADHTRQEHPSDTVESRGHMHERSKPQCAWLRLAELESSSGKGSVVNSPVCVIPSRRCGRQRCFLCCCLSGRWSAGRRGCQSWPAGRWHWGSQFSSLLWGLGPSQRVGGNFFC